MHVSPIPAGYPTLVPSCAVRDCERAVKAYQDVFGARLRLRLDYPDGKIAHCELAFGDSVMMMGEATNGVEPHGSRLAIYVTDCDAACEQARRTGFTVLSPPENQFYGDRSARVSDPFGNFWFIQTHIEDVSPAEMKRRMAAMPAS
jgi:PhnB protein